MIAFTEIRHGKDDGSVVVINEGDEVKGLPKDVVEGLKAQGIIGEQTSAAEVEDLNEENEELRAEVAELKKKLAEATKPQDPPK